MRPIGILRCPTFAVVLACVISNVARADNTVWRAEPTTTGDWFAPENWTAGAPESSDVVAIDNGGTALIAGGEALGATLRLGLENVGMLHQIGGTTQFRFSLYLGHEQDSFGTYLLEGGELSSQRLVVGASNGSGLFEQIGGNYRTGSIAVGDAPNTNVDGNPEDFGESRYELIGGQLTATSAKIGVRGLGIFRQSGGVFSLDRALTVGGQLGAFVLPTFEELAGANYPILHEGPADIRTDQASFIDSAVSNVYIPPPAPSDGLYELRGGVLRAREQFVDRTGQVVQTGASNDVAYLSIGDGGRYEYLGGSLQVSSGLDVGGTFDFGGSSASLAAGSALINLTKGLANAQQASIRVGADSLTLFSGNFDPEIELGRYSTEGLTHFAGSDLVLSAGEMFRGWGQIDDHVIASGEIAAADDGFIHLHGGIQLNDGARVALSDGRVTVKDDRTVIRGGSLSANLLSVVGMIQYDVQPAVNDQMPPTRLAAVLPAVARQTGGIIDLSGGFAISNGRFELTGGELTARSISLGGSFQVGSEFKAELFQSGGTITTESLSLVNHDPFTLYVTDSINDVQTLSLSPYTAFAQPIPIMQAETLSYRLDGGALRARTMSIGIGFGSGTARFIQTAGDVAVEQALSIAGGDSSYAMFGGGLTTGSLGVGRRTTSTTSEEKLAILDAAADIRIAGEFFLGTNSTFTAVPGVAIHMIAPEDLNVWTPPSGNRFDNYSTDSDALSGLANLTLIFEGGLAHPATFEVAGEDRGPGLNGFFDNFVLDTLQVGGDEVATLALVDLVDNQLDGEGQEALYVKHLIVGPGSQLDLGDLNIYYLSADIAADALVDTAKISAVPEPGTFMLFALGLVGQFIRRRKA